MIWLSIALLAIGLALLMGASGIVMSSIVNISEKRQLRKSVVSFFVLALATSLPELSVAVNAITLGNMPVSLGDILGSNITNISLIIGVSLVVATMNHSQNKKVTLEEEDRRAFTTGLMLLSVTLLMLLYLQYIGRLVGLMLLSIFFGYSYIVMRKRREEGEDNSRRKMDGRIGKDLVLAITGIAGVIVGARLTLESTIDIATFFEIPASVIGATLVALGTSLPELVVDIRAAYRGYLEISMGDIVGSCFLNSTLILGLLLAFAPFRVDIAVLSDLIVFSVLSNLVLWFFLDRGEMGRREGFILLTLYVVNLLSLLGILILRVP